MSTNIGHLVVDGTISLSQLLHMKVIESADLTGSITPPQKEGFLYLTESGSAPVLNLRYTADGSSSASNYTIDITSA